MSSNFLIRNNYKLLRRTLILVWCKMKNKRIEKVELIKQIKRLICILYSCNLKVKIQLSGNNLVAFLKANLRAVLRRKNTTICLLYTNNKEKSRKGPKNKLVCQNRKWRLRLLCVYMIFLLLKQQTSSFILIID